MWLSFKTTLSNFCFSFVFAIGLVWFVLLFLFLFLFLFTLLGDKEFLIITGPNMGGKSTYIRQVGLTIYTLTLLVFVDPLSFAFGKLKLIILRRTEPKGKCCGIEHKRLP